MQAHADNVYNELAKAEEFLPVSTISERLGISIETTLDALVILRTQGRAHQTEDGWKIKA